MSQDQLDRIEEKLDRIINHLERPITVEHTQELFTDVPTITAEKLAEVMADLKDRISNLKVNFGGADYERISENLSNVELQQRKLVKQTKAPFSLIKRVEYFTDRYLDMKSNRIVSYYLFDFMLIYRKIFQGKESKNLFPEEE